MFMINKMNKRVLLFILSVCLVLVGMNFVSAALCKGCDGYYHDCNDFYPRHYSKESGYTYYEGTFMKYSERSDDRYNWYSKGYRRGYNDGREYSNDDSDAVVVILEFEETENYRRDCCKRGYNREYYWSNCRDCRYS